MSKINEVSSDEESDDSKDNAFNRALCGNDYIGTVLLFECSLISVSNVCLSFFDFCYPNIYSPFRRTLFSREKWIA